MRNTSSGRKTRSTTSFSARALARSCPNGFSMTTRRHWPGCACDSPDRNSCSQTTGKDAGGTER